MPPESDTPPGEASFHAVVRGRVQGVGFRDFVCRRADASAIVGYVRNGEDGCTVEVEAEGGRQALEALLSDLRRGPSMSIVESVDVGWAEAHGWYARFSVHY